MPDRTDTRTRLHLWLTLLVALAVVAGVGVTLISGRVGSSSPDAATTGLIDGVLHLATLSDAHLACPSDAAFSPDGSRVLVLGTLTTSLASSPSPSCSATAQDSAPPTYAVGIFNSATGELVRVWTLDPLVRAASMHAAPVRAASTGGSGGGSQLTYSGLGWSPDGAHVAFVFTEFAASRQRTPENVIDSGLLLLDVEAGTASVLRGDSGFFATASGVSSGFPVWHLSQDTELPSFLPQPGLSYAWSPEGTPYPIIALHDTLDQLPISAGPRYPVGVPDGSPRYTIWQPGLVVGAGGSDMDSHLSSFVTAFAAWSPNGADVTLMVAGVTLSDESGGASMYGSATMRQERGAVPIPPVPIPPALPIVPARDPALVAVERVVGDRGWAVVGWNPSGSLLGSINCFATRNLGLELRDTSSGGLITSAALDLAPGDPGCRDAADAAAAVGGYPALGMSLQWSPAGDRLLLTDRSSSTLTLYHVRHHPAA